VLRLEARTAKCALVPRGLASDEKGIDPDVVVDSQPMAPEAIAARIARKRLPEAGDRTMQAAVAAVKAGSCSP
jgi:hypothetical protein